MEKKTINDLMKTYLVGEGFNEADAEKLIKNFHDVKNIHKDVVKKDEDKEEEVKSRHGTSCIGLITKKKVLAEW
jgi:hypothetical protein